MAMANVQKASAGVKLGRVVSMKQPPHVVSNYAQLEQESLKLAPKRVEIVQVRQGHERADVGQHVAEGSVENESVDGFVEGA